MGELTWTPLPPERKNLKRKITHRKKGTGTGNLETSRVDTTLMTENRPRPLSRHALTF